MQDLVLQHFRSAIYMDTIVIIFKTSENSSIKSTGELFFLQLLLGRHFESAQVHAGSSTPQEVVSCPDYTGSC